MKIIQRKYLKNVLSALYEATCTWSGVLPPRSIVKTIGYSSKVFLGGVPWDITEQMLIQTFKPFGPIRVEWPGKDKAASQPKGYVYVIFESEKNVKALLQSCTNDYADGGNWYYTISSKRMKSKEVSTHIPQVSSWSFEPVTKINMFHDFRCRSFLGLSTSRTTPSRLRRNWIQARRCSWEPCTECSTLKV